MNKRGILGKIIILVALLLILFMFFLSNKGKNTSSDNNTQIANPASVYCIDQGNNLTIRTNPDGSQTGYCTLPNGTECEEWKFFRKEC